MAQKNPGGKLKALTAAEKLQEIFPGAAATGESRLSGHLTLNRYYYCVF